LDAGLLAQYWGGEKRAYHHTMSSNLVYGLYTGLRMLLAEGRVVNLVAAEGHPPEVMDLAFGIEALALLRNSPADIAILDIRMPGMDGLELAEHIRKGGAGVDPALPIISITASQSEKLQSRLRQLGVFAQAEKPLSAGQLLQLISKAHGNTTQQARQETANVFDLAAALEKVDGKHALLRKLAIALLEELPQQQQTLARAMEQNDPAQVRYLAHALKNSAAMLQLHQLQAAGAALENAAHAQQDCRQAWQTLQETVPTAHDALRAYVDNWVDAI
jgi:CheY-like chemotaxis protein